MREREILTVYVVGAAGVVARYEGIKEGDAILVGWLHAAEGGGVDDGLVVGVTVTGIVEDTAVDTLHQILDHGRCVKR